MVRPTPRSFDKVYMSVVNPNEWKLSLHKCNQFQITGKDHKVVVLPWNEPSRLHTDFQFDFGKLSVNPNSYKFANSADIYSIITFMPPLTITLTCTFSVSEIKFNLLFVLIYLDSEPTNLICMPVKFHLNFISERKLTLSDAIPITSPPAHQLYSRTR